MSTLQVYWVTEGNRLHQQKRISIAAVSMLEMASWQFIVHAQLVE